MGNKNGAAFVVLVSAVFFLRTAYAGFGVETRADLALQISRPVLGIYGLGISPQFDFGSITALVFGSYDRFTIQYTDAKLSYTELGYGLGLKTFFSATNYFHLRAGQSVTSYAGYQDKALKVGGGLGVLVSRIGYSVGYFRYLGFDRESLEFNLGFNW